MMARMARYGLVAGVVVGFACALAQAEEPRREEAKREEGKREEAKREEAKREEAKREEIRRLERLREALGRLAAKREEARREEAQREDRQREERRREERQREERRREERRREEARREEGRREEVRREEVRREEPRKVDPEAQKAARLERALHILKRGDTAYDAKEYLDAYLAYDGLATIFADLDAGKTAAEKLEAMKDDPAIAAEVEKQRLERDAANLLALATMYEANGLPEKAVARLREFVLKYPDRPEVEGVKTRLAELEKRLL